MVNFMEKASKAARAFVMVIERAWSDLPL